MTAAARTPRTRWASGLVAAVIALVGLVVSGCGADVATTMTLNAGPSGSRTMTLTLSASDLSQGVNGGVRALDASIARHKPAALTYSGATTNPDGSVTGTFTLAFGSLDDYRTKVTALLQAGQSRITPTITMEVDAGAPGTQFKQSSTLKENFTSADLLGWLANALVADGVVTGSNKSSVFGGTTSTKVVFGSAGGTVATREPIGITGTYDNGFTALLVDTDLTGADLVRTLRFTVPASQYAASPTLYDSYLDAATPSGGTLKGSADGQGQHWTMTFHAGDPADLTAKTNQALDSSATVFDLQANQTTDNPLVTTTTIADYVECAVICAAGATIAAQLTVPPTWAVGSGTPPGTTVNVTAGALVYPHGVSDPNALYVFSHILGTDEVTVTTTLGLRGEVTAAITYYVTAADEAASHNLYTQAFTPSPAVGAMTTASVPGRQAYTVTLSAASRSDFATRLAAYLPGSQLSVGAQGNPLAARDDLGFTFDFSRRLGEPPAKGFTFQVGVPWPQSIAQASSTVGRPVVVDGRTASLPAMTTMTTSFAVTAAGLTYWGIVAAAGAGVLTLIAAILLWVFRHRISAALAARRERRVAARAAAEADGETRASVEDLLSTQAQDMALATIQAQAGGQVRPGVPSPPSSPEDYVGTPGTPPPGPVPPPPPVPASRPTYGVAPPETTQVLGPEGTVPFLAIPGRGADPAVALAQAAWAEQAEAGGGAPASGGTPLSVPASGPPVPTSGPPVPPPDPRDLSIQATRAAALAQTGRTPWHPPAGPATFVPTDPGVYAPAGAGPYVPPQGASPHGATHALPAPIDFSRGHGIGTGLGVARPHDPTPPPPPARAAVTPPGPDDVPPEVQP